MTVVGLGLPVAWIHVGAPTQVWLSADGHRVWVGTGVPAVVPGATYGDLYLDADTGILYRLD
jgi:hypothetical protein